MQVRYALEGKEHCHTDRGELICCPVCGATWLDEAQGRFTAASCQHLRFTLHSEGCDEFDFFGDWNPAGFQSIVRRAIMDDDEDEDADFVDILEKMEHPDVDMAILYVWRDDPLYQPWMIWGFKCSNLF